MLTEVPTKSLCSPPLSAWAFGAILSCQNDIVFGISTKQLVALQSSVVVVDLLRLLYSCCLLPAEYPHGYIYQSFQSKPEFAIAKALPRPHAMPS